MFLVIKRTKEWLWENSIQTKVLWHQSLSFLITCGRQQVFLPVVLFLMKVGLTESIFDSSIWVLLIDFEFKPIYQEEAGLSFTAKLERKVKITDCQSIKEINFLFTNYQFTNFLCQIYVWQNSYLENPQLREKNTLNQLNCRILCLAISPKLILQSLLFENADRD